MLNIFANTFAFSDIPVILNQVYKSPRDIKQCLERFLVVMLGKELGMLL